MRHAWLECRQLLCACSMRTRRTMFRASGRSWSWSGQPGAPGCGRLQLHARSRLQLPAAVHMKTGMRKWLTTAAASRFPWRTRSARSGISGSASSRSASLRPFHLYQEMGVAIMCLLRLQISLYILCICSCRAVKDILSMQSLSLE